MDTLVSLGIIASTVWSLYAMFWRDTSRVPSVHPLHAGAPLGRGHLPRRGGRRDDVRAGRALLRGVVPAAVGQRAARARRGGGEGRRRSSTRWGSSVAAPCRQLGVGDRFIVRPGETVATDGEVVFGQSAVDRSLLTGESQPLDVAVGDLVVGGTVSTSGRLVVRATKVGRDTQLAQMLRLVEHAQNEKAAVQRLADRVCNVFVPAVLLIALATLATWLLLGYPSDQAFTAALAVLVIACPCALGLATPAALYVAAGEGARAGIFFKGYRALEASKQIDTVVLDKTGTLTTGKMRVTDIAACPVATSARSCAGPVLWSRRRSIRSPWPSRPVRVRSSARFPRSSRSSARPGLGAEGMVEGHRITIGRVTSDSGRLRGDGALCRVGAPGAYGGPRLPATGSPSVRSPWPTPSASRPRRPCASSSSSACGACS